MEDFLSNVWKGVVEYWILICVIAATASMALLRTAKQNGKLDYVEATICTIFALSIYFVLEWLGFPQEAGIGIGTFIGHIGSVRFSKWVIKKIGFDIKK